MKTQIAIYSLLLTISSNSLTAMQLPSKLKSKALLQTINSSLKASTFVGGSGPDDTYEPAITTDKQGNIYISGYTYSQSFQTTNEALYQSHQGGQLDRFIAKYDTTLKTLIAATYFGGSKDDAAYSIILNNNGLLYITGITTSADFPIAVNAHDSLHGSYSDCFITAFDTSFTQYNTSINDNTENMPHILTLFPNFPNPF
ncbi:SBBP repeat-containing protein [bacterium]|nr:SBBP repeat-containing protein [bacterium]